MPMALPDVSSRRARFVSARMPLAAGAKVAVLHVRCSKAISDPISQRTECNVDTVSHFPRFPTAVGRHSMVIPRSWVGLK